MPRTVQTFRVRWEIDVDAVDPQEAALKARDLQEPGTTALVFDCRDDRGRWSRVDLAKVYARA